MTSPRRHLLIAGAAWVVLSVVAMVAVAGIQILPTIASREAEIEDTTFVLLTVLAMPILMLVVVGLIYSALFFRARGPDDTEDGPPVHGHTGFQATWVVVSAGLVLGLFGYGTVGLLDIRGAQEADFVIQVHAEQWKWTFTYPDYEVAAKELHVPVDQRVRLEITSDDVVHSFWVPPFGIKQDAVPGRTTTIYLTVTTAGHYGGMCAELCGLGHTTMTFDTVADSLDEVEAWLASQPPPEGPPAEGSPPEGPPPSEAPH